MSDIAGVERQLASGWSCEPRRASSSSTTTPANVDILRARLAAHGYEIHGRDRRRGGAGGRARASAGPVLLDVMMPKLDGIEVCRRLRADASMPFIPIILVTAKSDPKDVVAALEAGGDEYLTKPVDQAALVARVKSMLRIKALQDTVHEQAWRMEHAGAARRRAARPTGAARPAQALLLAAARRADPRRRRRRSAEEPSPRSRRGVPRPARLHRVCRDHRARGDHGRVARVSRARWGR